MPAGPWTGHPVLSINLLTGSLLRTRHAMRCGSDPPARTSWWPTSMGAVFAGFPDNPCAIPGGVQIRSMSAMTNWLKRWWSLSQNGA